MRLIAAALPWELKIAKEYWGSSKDVLYLCTWMGSAQTIFSLTASIVSRPEISEIVFFGICGYVWEVPALVQIANTQHTSAKKEYILPQQTLYAPLVTILTSDMPLHDPMILLKWWYRYVDMESWGVALVADKLQLPCTILRVPYDEVGTIDCEHFDKHAAMEKMRRWLETIRL